MDLPIDHFRLLGVSPTSDAQGVLHVLQQRLNRVPEQDFTPETLAARELLLRASADLLTDPQRRQLYETELTSRAAGPEALPPALEVAFPHEIAGLLLLLEAGQPLECFELACRALQPPQAPALGSGREGDLTLLAGLACLAAAADLHRQRRYELAAQILRQGLQLLQRMGQLPALRQQLVDELEGLRPFRVLDLLSRDLTATAERSEGLTLLEELVQARGGLEGELDPQLPPAEFQAFFKQIRAFLTVQEQIDLFCRWAPRSAAADFLATTALTASGFAQRKPERIAAARERLLASAQPGTQPLLACLELLLGQVESAQRRFREGADGPLLTWAERQSSDPLAQVCAYCRDWLARDVLPGYRDLEADPDLEAYFADRDVQAWVEQHDEVEPLPASPAPLGSLASGSDLGFSAAAGLAPLAQDQSETGAQTRSPQAGSGLISGLGGFDGGFTPQGLALPLALPTDGAPADPFAAGPPEPEPEPDPGSWGPLRWDSIRSWPGLAWLGQLPRPSLPLPLQPSRRTLALAAATAIGAGLAAAVVLRARQSARPATPIPVQLPPAQSPPTRPPLGVLQPPPPADSPASSPAGSPPATGQRPATRAAGLPLQQAAPGEAALQQLLEAWLAAKAAVLAGQQPALAPAGLAEESLVRQLQAERRADQAAGIRQIVRTTIESVQISERSDRQIAARVSLRYGERRQDAAGAVVQELSDLTLHNLYLFQRGSDGTWRLASFQRLS